MALIPFLSLKVSTPLQLPTPPYIAPPTPRRTNNRRILSHNHHSRSRITSLQPLPTIITQLQVKVFLFLKFISIFPYFHIHHLFIDPFRHAYFLQNCFVINWGGCCSVNGFQQACDVVAFKFLHNLHL